VKVALLVPGGVDRSGEVRVIPALVALIERFARGHEVHVFATHQEPEPAKWSLRGAVIHNIGQRGARALRALATLRREHALGAFDVVQSIWAGNHALLAVAFGRLSRLPALVHVAGGELVAIPDIGYGGAQSPWSRMRETAVLRAAAAVTAASLPMLAALELRGVSADRLPLGADLSVWQPQAPIARDANVPLRVVHVASLNRVKDQTTLLHAMALLAKQGRHIELDIVGEDTLGGEIQALASRLELNSHVRFHGFLNQDSLQSLVRKAHVHVVSSRHEAGPVAMLEAAAVGVPTVGTAVGHVAEWSPLAALAVTVHDSAALAAGLARLLENEPLRLSLANAAHARALREDADFTAARFLDLYARVRESRRSR
jgi:glycosyltransferase involved in cell wall biosynthesis